MKAHGFENQQSFIFVVEDLLQIKKANDSVNGEVVLIKMGLHHGFGQGSFI